MAVPAKKSRKGTIIGAIVLGNTWRHSNFGVEVPSVTAAST